MNQASAASIGPKNFTPRQPHDQPIRLQKNLYPADLMEKNPRDILFEGWFDNRTGSAKMGSIKSSASRAVKESACGWSAFTLEKKEKEGSGSRRGMFDGWMWGTLGRSSTASTADDQGENQSKWSSTYSRNTLSDAEALAKYPYLKEENSGKTAQAPRLRCIKTSPFDYRQSFASPPWSGKDIPASRSTNGEEKQRCHGSLIIIY
ncbi:MAG: hypothetical protein WCI46_12540 [Verrucomicrobiota bacterium]